MVKNIFILLAFITLLLSSCGNFESNLVFEKPIKGRTINLSRKVGKAVQVIRKNDTINYSFSFDKSNDINYIVKAVNDTIFKGSVTKRNELFLLNRKLPNGKFAIHALKFTDSTVTGLETEWLQSSIIMNQIDSGNYTNLITNTTEVKTIINVEKKVGRELFRFVIEQLQADRLVISKSKFLIDHNTNDTLNKKTILAPINKNNLITKVYPNPFNDYINIDLAKKAPYVFVINDLNGKRIKTVKQSSSHIKIDLPNLETGFYLLSVYSSESELIDKTKLIKK